MLMTMMGGAHPGILDDAAVADITAIAAEWDIAKNRYCLGGTNLVDLSSYVVLSH